LTTRERLTVYSSCDGPPDISSLSLHTIVLDGIVEVVYYPDSRAPPGAGNFFALCPTPWMTELFQKVSKFSSICEVELRFQVVVPWPLVSDQLWGIFFSLWDDLANALLSKWFHQLRRVKISIDVLHLFNTDLTPFRKIDSYCGLHMLKQAGLLVFEL
jgi:hypothetical protein